MLFTDDSFIFLVATALAICFVAALPLNIASLVIGELNTYYYAA